MNYFKGFHPTAIGALTKGPRFSKYCYQLVLGTVLLALPLSSAQAQQYNPPDGDPPQTSTVSNGSRGECREGYDLPLIGLAPTLANHVGQTSTTTPTFAWFVPTAQPYRIRLSLYTVDQENLLYETEYEDSVSEIVTLTVPENVGLESGQRYLWEVNISCDLDAPTYQEFFISEFDVIPSSTDLTAALALAQTSQEKVSLYAEAGYWYDALKSALEASEDISLVQRLLSSLATSEEGLQGQYLSQVTDIIGNSDM